MRGYLTDPDADGGLRLAEDLPEPDPAGDEVVVEVRAYSVNRGETVLLEQRADGWRPGQDVAGEVVRAAADGNGPSVGTRVVGIVDGAGWSERVGIPARFVAPLPDAVSFQQASTLPIAGLTALRALRVDGPVLGRTVLVTGATGGVGQFAVQLAVAAGARVTAQVSRRERAQEAFELGAHEVVVDLGDAHDAGPFDLVLDALGGPVLKAAVHRLVPGGTAVTYGALGGPAELTMRDFAAAPLGKVVGFFHHVPVEERGADLATLAWYVADGRVRPRIGLTDDWERTPSAIGALRKREVRGKAVLTRG